MSCSARLLVKLVFVRSMINVLLASNVNEKHTYIYIHTYKFIQRKKNRENESEALDDRRQPTTVTEIDHSEGSM